MTRLTSVEREVLYDEFYTVIGERLNSLSDYAVNMLAKAAIDAVEEAIEKRLHPAPKPDES
jgi:hypothetical protein